MTALYCRMPSLRRNVFIRSGCGSALALGTAYMAASVLPEYAAWLGWVITAAAFAVIGRQVYTDYVGWRQSQREDERDANVLKRHDDL